MLAYLLAAGVQAAAAADAAPIPEARSKRIPSVYERALAYPDHAAARGLSGEATAKCRINDIGMPTKCSVHSERPPGEGFGQALMPGGNHVMLMGLSEELAPGDEVELVLEFSDGSARELTVPVKEFTEEEGHYHESDAPHSHPSDSMSGSTNDSTSDSTSGSANP